MYLKVIYLENTGPISKCHVELPFDRDGNPQPVVIVGPNGSGKSIFLSYVVDALMEFSKRAFDDIVPPDGLITPYFRIVHSRLIRSGQRFSLSLLRFKAADSALYYSEEFGEHNWAIHSPDLQSVFRPVWGKKPDEDHKYVFVDEKIVETEMRDGVYAFFPASRREEPDWLNPESIRSEPNPFFRQFSRQLDKPLWVETCSEKNISWILDVFLDSLIDLAPGLRLADGQNLVYRNVNNSELEDLRNRSLLHGSRQNVESLLQAILQDETAKLDLNYRNISSSRISIKMKNGRIVPTLHALSEGQSQLLHLFTTIIRYGERTYINRSVHLSQITGLVVIDEVAAHLHPTLQHDVLPKLIRLFPKVQFIISSHSPLFLLGMEKEFGPDGLDILELPNGNRISSERFSEFGKAFEYYKTTESFEEEVKLRFADMTKPVVLTEGKTDVQYILTALELLEEEDLLNSLEIKPVGKENNEGDEGGGESGLNNFRKVYAAKPLFFHQPILLLYDSEAKNIPKSVGKLSVKSIPPNAENTRVIKGIENLFRADLFQDCFYRKRPTGDGGHSKRLDKPKFCKWICENGGAADFEGFESVVKILKEFVAAHQSSSDQQSTSE